MGFGFGSVGLVLLGGCLCWWDCECCLDVVSDWWVVCFCGFLSLVLVSCFCSFLVLVGISYLTFGY